MITQSTMLTKEAVEIAEKNGTLDDLHGQEVNRLIRLKYPQRDENAIYRHKFNGTGDAEFETFNAYCEECKVIAWETIERFKN